MPVRRLTLWRQTRPGVAPSATRLAALGVALVTAVTVGIAPAYAGVGAITVAGGNGHGSASNQLSYPHGIALDSAGTLYIAEDGTWEVNSGRVQAWAPGASAGVTVAAGLNSPLDVEVDANGNVYILEQDDGTVEMWAPGASSGTTVASGLAYAYGMTLDAAGNVYVAEAAAGRVLRWAPGSSAGVVVAGGEVGSAANQLDWPTDVAVDAGGSIYVADYHNNRVQKWPPGATSGMTVAGGITAGFGQRQLSGPWAVAVDASGNVVVADQYNHRVQRWAPGATSGVTVAGGLGPGSGADQLDHPRGIALDPAGNVFVSDTFNDRVQRWAPSTVTQPIAVDTFARTEKHGWGTATIGGAWTSTTPSGLSVRDAAGGISFGARTDWRNAFLQRVSVRDVDMTALFQFAPPAPGMEQAAYLVARHVDSSTEYRAKLRLRPDRYVSVQAEKVVDGRVTTLGDEVVLPWGPLGNPIVRVHARFSGADPTTITIRAWLLDEPEPTTWQVIASDSEDVLQVTGTIGIRAVALAGRHTPRDPGPRTGAPHAKGGVVWVYDVYAW